MAPRNIDLASREALRINLLPLPHNAMVSGNAIGDDANKMGVYGASENSVAIYGKSPFCAGSFDGDVDISGELTLGGNQSVNKLMETVSHLVQTIKALDQRITECEHHRVTRGGALVTLPTRPTIQVTGVSPSFQGRVIFNVQGAGFNHGGRILLTVFDATSNRELLPEGQVLNATVATSQFLALQDGSLLTQVTVQANSGDTLIVSATDGRPDPNDLTGSLWTTPVAVPVP